MSLKFKNYLDSPLSLPIISPHPPSSCHPLRFHAKKRTKMRFWGLRESVLLLCVNPVGAKATDMTAEG